MSGQEANVVLKQKSIHITCINTFVSNINLKLFGD